NRRLVGITRGTSDTLFLNAQNNQTIWRLIDPLRDIGVPAAAIADLDMIKNGGQNWENILKACRVPTQQNIHLENERLYFANLFQSMATSTPKAPEPMKSKGVNALSPGDRTRCEVFL